jgi:tetratricopeptide (TPR) repeat protein
MKRLTLSALIVSCLPLVATFAQRPFPFEQWQDAVTASHIGVLKGYRGDLDGAIAQFDYVIRLHPNDPIAYYNRALVESVKRDFGKAVADFEHAIQLNPQFARAYNDLGSVHANEGDLDQAIADFDHALKINPRFAEAHDNLGSVKAMKGDLDGAVAEFNLAVQFDPDFGQAFDNLGSAKLRKGDLDGAIANFEQALRINPRDYRALRGEGLCKYATGDLSGAVSPLIVSSELAPHTTDGYLHLIIWLVRAEQGQLASANQELSAYLKSRGSAPAHDWLSRLGAFLLGPINESDLLAAADAGDPQTDRAQHCEAWFYAGMKRLLAGDKQGASNCFKNCVATQESAFDEYMLAQAELRRLGGAL